MVKKIFDEQKKTIAEKIAGRTMRFYCITYCTQNRGPGMTFEVVHIFCKNKKEQSRTIAAYKCIFPTHAPHARCLSLTSAREEVPFVHDPLNNSSVNADRFFKIKRFWRGGAYFEEPILERMMTNDFMSAFSKITGRETGQICRRFETVSEMAAAGGRSRSEAKAAASRINGKLGGRPIKRA